MLVVSQLDLKTEIEMWWWSYMGQMQNNCNFFLVKGIIGKLRSRQTCVSTFPAGAKTKELWKWKVESKTRSSHGRSLLVIMRQVLNAYLSQNKLLVADTYPHIKFKYANIKRSNLTKNDKTQKYSYARVCIQLFHENHLIPRSSWDGFLCFPFFWGPSFHLYFQILKPN